jgi:hypothetical protein
MPDKQLQVQRFATEVILQDEARSSDEGNAHAMQQLAAFDGLVNEYGDDGREALAGLLVHEDIRVRVMAASFLLRYKHEDSMRVLEDASHCPGLPGLAAKCSIENWMRGVWELDPK